MTTLKKKHYIEIAKIINKNYAPTKESELVKRNIVFDLADYFQEERIEFDKEKFLKGCGVK